MKKISLFLIAFFLLSSCGGSKKAKPQEVISGNSRRVAEFSDEPSWFKNIPKSSSYYYFGGVGKSKTRAGAKNAALADVFSQIVYLTRASISSNSSFEKYVEENEKDFRKNSSIFKKVRAKGSAVIDQFEVDKQKSLKDGKKNLFYVLVKVPKSEINKARKRLEKEAALRRKNAMAVVAVAVFPNKRVQKLDSLQSALEGVYREMGFRILTSNTLYTKASTFQSTAKMLTYFKRSYYPTIKKVLICVVRSSSVRKERKGSLRVTSILGQLTIREIDLGSSEILSVKSFDSKGVSLRKGRSAVEDAFRKLISSLQKQILSDGDDKEDEY